MKSIIFFLLLAPVILQGQKYKNFETTMYNYIQKNHPGFNGVILMADKGTPLFHQAFGYRLYASQTPLQKDDIFELASVSKQFTAMIIMMLKEKNKLSFDDPVEKFLDLPYKNITIRHLLTHTSGLPDYQAIMDQHWDKSKVAGNKDILDYLRKYAPPANFLPGEKYEYSNTGYVLLASIAEAASGIDFIQLCNSWIFLPLNMNSTRIRSLKEKAAVPNFALGHLFIPERGFYQRADSFPSSNYTIWLGNRKGPGRISSTASDLLIWDQALYTDKLVSQTTLEHAFSSMRLNDGSFSHYGFGWDLPDNTYRGRIVMHNGDNPGYHTLIVRNIGRKKTILILSNNAYEKMKELQEELEATFF